MPFSATPSILCISPYDSDGLEEADAAIVGVAHQMREAVLPQVALHLAADGAGAERQACHLHAGTAERDQIGRAAALGEEWKATGCRHRAGGQSGLEEFASSEMRHDVPLQPE